jgi:AcrR family transcriptional regulator
MGRKPQRPELRGRRRNKQCHQAILEATLKLVTERGYPAVSIEAIAAAAGVGKQTIYRWWSSKASVVFEALSNSIVVSNPPIDKGNVQADLEEFLGWKCCNFAVTP